MNKKILVIFILINITTKIDSFFLKSYPVTHDKKIYKIEKNNIKIEVQAFSNKEINSFFKFKFSKYKVTPFILSITNKSKDVYHIGKSFITLPLANYNTTANIFKINMTKILLFSFPFWLDKNFIFINSILGLIWYYNKLIEKYFINMPLYDNQEIKIKPFQKFSTLIFVHAKHCDSDFLISLLNDNSKEILTFPIYTLKNVHEQAILHLKHFMPK